MAKSYVFSTLANDQLYTNWQVSDIQGQDPAHIGHVLIHGGAGIANARTLYTPNGAVTEVTEEELALLEQNQDFQRHKKGGFITVRARRAEVDAVASDMSAGDKSRPYTPKSAEFNVEKIIEA